MSLASKTALMNALRCASVACGGSHTLGSLRSGAVCSWGGGGAQLGQGAIADDMPLPQKIGSLSGVRAVATGAAHSMAVTAQGQLWAWGHNGEGQLGTEVASAKGQRQTHEAPRPLRVASLSAVKVKHVACGTCFTLAITAQGDTLSWGDGCNGQLGHGACTSEAAPRVVKALLGKRARLPACGAAHSALLCGSGDAYLFGRNGDGELRHDVLQPRVCQRPHRYPFASGLQPYAPSRLPPRAFRLPLQAPPESHPPAPCISRRAGAGRRLGHQPAAADAAARMCRRGPHRGARGVWSLPHGSHCAPAAHRTRGDARPQRRRRAAPAVAGGLVVGLGIGGSR